jgi:DNA-binding transcriptional regulator GbsR (MarR family)
MAEHLGLMTSVVCKVIQASDSWQNKKVKKTGLCVNLFVKAAKIISKQKTLNSAAKEHVVMEGARVIKALEAAIESDKTMSNLKGKVKEIKTVCVATH